MNDWKLIKDYYGINEIAKVASSIKDMDKKSAIFVSSLSGISKEEFACFISTQLILKHRNI
ncbi:MAG: hypothetical protein JXB49_28800 [Bacteroidales bacterium]|nr:hypothetical protein [Bacteroidales bacterium]